jgi:hypothetical protein
MGGAPQVQAPAAPDPGRQFTSALAAYTGGAPALYAEESKYQPQYNQLQQQMQLSNNQAFAQQYFNMFPQAQQAANMQQQQASASALSNLQQYGGAATQAQLATNPAYGQLYQAAQQQLATSPDQTLQGLLAQGQQALPGQIQGFQDISAQAQRDVTPVNEQLQNLYGKVGADTTAADLADIRNKVAADPRSQIFQQTAGNIMGNLGQVDPLTQQLKTMAGQQLSLGSTLSAQEAQDAAQQARAGWSARGMMGSSGSLAAEVLNRFNVGQQLLQQREQFGTGVSQLAEQQAQNRVANAFGLTQADIGATQANMQMAGQMTQAIGGLNQANTQLQAGLQGQIMQNLSNLRQQQAGLQGQAVQTFQQGLQQAAGLQGSILDQMYRQQQAGMQGLQYYTQAGQQGLAAILGVQGQGASLAQAALGATQVAGGAPNLFNSSGMLQLTNQSAMANMNAQGSANIANAQARQQQQGAMIGAGGAIVGAAVGAALL